MAATYKSAAYVRQIAENIALRTSLTAVTGVDASGNPTIAVGTGAAGSQSAFVRIKQDYDPSLQLNGIDAVQRVYTPHVIQVVLETSTIANVALMTEANKWKLMKELEVASMKIELYMTANTTAVTVAGITAGNLKATIDSLWHPLTETL